MNFINALILVKTAADNNILKYVCPKKRHVFIYREQGDINHPEGWYVENIEDVSRAVMEDDQAQELLLSKLKEIGVDVPWFSMKEFNSFCNNLQNIAFPARKENV